MSNGLPPRIRSNSIASAPSAASHSGPTRSPTPTSRHDDPPPPQRPVRNFRTPSSAGSVGYLTAWLHVLATLQGLARPTERQQGKQPGQCWLGGQRSASHSDPPRSRQSRRFDFKSPAYAEISGPYPAPFNIEPFTKASTVRKSPPGCRTRLRRRTRPRRVPIRYAGVDLDWFGVGGHRCDMVTR